MDQLVENLVATMNEWPPEFMWVLLLFTCFTTVLCFNRYMGSIGLYAYIAVAIVGSNIQVLKAVQFGLYSKPVAMGTILFSSVYLATDILGEHYGVKAAKRGVYLGFFVHLFFSVIMLITLGFAPLTAEQAGSDMAWALPYHDHMSALFTLQFSLFSAGMLAYLASQLHDVWFFGWLKKRTKNKYLWLRNNASTAVSAFIDNTIFSILAWIILSANPLPFKTVFFTYILGTYWLRMIVALLDTPVIYLSKIWKYSGNDILLSNDEDS